MTEKSKKCTVAGVEAARARLSDVVVEDGLCDVRSRVNAASRPSRP